MTFKPPPKWWPTLADKVDIAAKIPPEADQNFRLLFNAINDHGDAVVELKNQLDAITSGATPVPIPVTPVDPGGGGEVVITPIPTCEVPIGVIDGVNNLFASSGVPNPISTFTVSLNGVDQNSNISGALTLIDVTINNDGTFSYTVTPSPPDWHVIRYWQ